MAKDKGLFAILVIVVIVLVAGVGTVMYTTFSPVKETAIPDDGAKAGGETASVASSLGVYSMDVAAISGSPYQVATPIYAWEDGFPGKLLADAKASSATTTTKIDGINTKKKYNVGAFNGTYYSVVLDSNNKGTLGFQKVAVELESETAQINNYKISRDLAVDLQKGTTMITGKDSTLKGSWHMYGNVSMTASQTDTFNLKVKNNQSSTAYNLYAFGVDVPVGTNVSEITNSGLVSTMTVPQRLKDTVNYVFAISQPVMLMEFDSYTTPEFKIKADSDGCSTKGEEITWYTMDMGQYKSVASTTLSNILTGVEDDSSSHNDVGGPDVTVVMNCNSGN